MEFGQKIFLEIDLFDFMSFFGLDYFKFSGPLCNPLFYLFFVRLRQEIAHPAGVRLTLRKRDCQNSLALVEIFGCLWVAGWKQRDFPILFNAFHVGDQILSVAGQPVRTASDFNKLVKCKTSNSGPNPGM